MPSTLLLTIHVKPGTKANKIISASEKEMTVALHAPATEGKANEALITFLAKHFHVAKSRVLLKRGFSSKTKKVEIL